MPPQPDAVAGWVGVRQRSDHQMRPERGKGGASRAPARLSCVRLLAAFEARAPAREGAMRIDFEISGGGTVYLLRPLTHAAHAWIAEHLPADAIHLGDAVAAEWRYIGDIVGGAIADGLVVR
jgi:hypothetical protein